MLKAVTKKRAYEDITRQIRSLVEKGKYKKGDRLPTERELSHILRVSRSTVREAIFSLEMMKLVERRQGDGTYVCAQSEEALVQPLAASLFQERDDIIDIFHIRKILEPEIAHQATENATPEEIERLEEIIRKQEKEVKLGRNPARSDADFHHHLARMTKNAVLERLDLALFDFMGKTRRRYLQTEERKQESLSGHHRILKAIRDGDRETARLAMLQHLRDLENILFTEKRKTKKTSVSGKGAAPAGRASLPEIPLSPKQA